MDRRKLEDKLLQQIYSLVTVRTSPTELKDLCMAYHYVVSNMSLNDYFYPEDSTEEYKEAGLIKGGAFNG